MPREIDLEVISGWISSMRDLSIDFQRHSRNQRQADVDYRQKPEKRSNRRKKLSQSGDQATSCTILPKLNSCNYLDLRTFVLIYSHPTWKILGVEGKK